VDKHYCYNSYTLITPGTLCFWFYTRIKKSHGKIESDIDLTQAFEINFRRKTINERTLQDITVNEEETHLVALTDGSLTNNIMEAAAIICNQNDEPLCKIRVKVPSGNISPKYLFNLRKSTKVIMCYKLSMT
jgi:hypothetical protein